MKREPLNHERVFDDPAYAAGYAKNHQKMAQKFGEDYADKLTDRGFIAGRILDSGCGPGDTALVLGRRFVESEVVGIDLSEPLLEIAEGGARSEGLEGRVRFEKANVQQIPFEDDSFDVVLNINMVHLVEEPLQMLNEIERVLRPGGTLYITDLRRSWLGLLESEIKSAFTLKEARELFRSSSIRAGKFSSGLIWWRFEA